MLVSSCPSEVRKLVRKQRCSGNPVGVVPTMGALHAGHVSLIDAARTECRFVVATIFVNPTQFGPNEDFEKYPRTLDDDLTKCRAAGADLVFIPERGQMYQANAQSSVRVSELTTMLEGAERPTHFDGVTTIVAKLFNITLPNRAYFGQKDYQQQLIIRQMVRDLDWDIEIITCPIVRESDGLAMSSRNRYLSKDDRQRALVIHSSLLYAQKQAAQGKDSCSGIEAELSRRISDTDGVELDYAVIADVESLQPVSGRPSSAVALVAVRVGETRLLDNQILRFL